MRLWYFLLSMHHVDSPWMESIVLLRPLNLLSSEASKDPPVPAAMSTEANLYHSNINLAWAST